MSRIFTTPMQDIGVNATLYTTGDALGSKQSTTVPEHGIIKAIIVSDRTLQSVTLEVVMFQADFTGTTNNAAFAMTDADDANLIGVVSVGTYFAFNANSVAVARDLGLPYWAPGGLLYYQCITRGGPTYTANEVFVRFVIEVP